VGHTHSVSNSIWRRRQGGGARAHTHTHTQTRTARLTAFGGGGGGGGVHTHTRTARLTAFGGGGCIIHWCLSGVGYNRNSGYCDPVEMEFGHCLKFTCQKAINIVCFEFIPEFWFLCC
jgi:hypothetical protein